MPSVEDLKTICDFKLIDPATNLPGIELACYWASNHNANNPMAAWTIDMSDGEARWKPRSDLHRIRYVRGKHAI